MVDLDRKFQFFNFAARKMNIFSRPVEVKASFHSGKLSVDWNVQENFSQLSCELWDGTNDFNTKKISCPFQSTDNFPEWKLAFSK
jgi:hypothetical protein